jgi:hypothetical protein
MFEEAEVKAGMNGWNCRCHEKFVRLLLGENKGFWTCYEMFTT